MATLALAVVGGAVGAGIGGTFLGISAAALGFSIGSLVGGQIDRALFGDESAGRRPGSRLGDLTVQSSTYGRMMPVIYGGRVAGNVIWSTDKREVRQVSSQSQGGKGGPSVTTTSESHHYYVSLAVSLGEGPIAGLRRIWADGTLIWDSFDPDRSLDGITIHLGTADQEPDPVIESHEGFGNAPAYRGQAYAVFEDFYLNDYGRRIPNFTFEVIGSLTAGWGEEMAAGVAVEDGGDAWLIANLQRTVARIDLATLAAKAVIGRDDGNAEDYLGRLRAQPWRICREPVSGHLFVTSLTDSCVQRIDPATDTVMADIELDIYPQEIIADGLGNLWVSHPLLDRLTRIAGADNAVASIGMAGQPFAFCRDGDGRLWVSCTSELVHFDPVGVTELNRVPLGGKWFPGGLAYNSGDGRVWFACSGNDVVGIVDPADYALSWRNSGTWPAYAASHPDDDRHTVYVSLLFGNRVKLLRRGEGNGLEEFAEYKTGVWPGPLAALADGRCLVSNTNRPFFQEVEGP